MKITRTPRRGKGWEIILAGLLLFGLIWLASGPSEASESHKKVSEGYEGDKRVKLLTEPVRAKSGETITHGYIGNERIRLHTIRKNEYTEIRGWKGDEYVHIKERDDSGKD